MPLCNPPSLKPLWQTPQDGHDCKHFLRHGQLMWPGDLTWSDLGSKISHIVQNWCAKSYAKRCGATRRGFLVMRKKTWEGGNICPPPTGAKVKSQLSILSIETLAQALTWNSFSSGATRADSGQGGHSWSCSSCASHLGWSLKCICRTGGNVQHWPVKVYQKCTIANEKHKTTGKCILNTIGMSLKKTDP